jgi:hypothetical protein
MRLISSQTEHSGHFGNSPQSDKPLLFNAARQKREV